MIDTLYGYYATQDVRPTYAAFSVSGQLEKYSNLRRHVFNRLQLPPAMFAERRVLEFGPDTGENSLVFAQWGARLTLVEPDAEAHTFINRYFDRFGLRDRLDGVIAASLLDYAPPHQFDIVDAEGFIYTVQPTNKWIEKTGSCLKRDGLLIVSYMELYGSFIELLQKAIHSCAIRARRSVARIEMAKELFLPKWESIPHTRSLESWFMDVIENPFVRRKYCIDPVDLLTEAYHGGFRLYSSWPNYRDTLNMRWIKSSVTDEEERQSATSFIEQSRLSHLLGTKCFLPTVDVKLNGNLDKLIRLTDKLIDSWSEEACAEAAACTLAIEQGMQRAVYDDGGGKARDVATMIKTVFELMILGQDKPLVDFCRTDATFISTWGMPAHYAVLQRTV